MHGTKTARIFEFEGFKLDSADHSLTYHGSEIPLRPKCFDVLAYLAGNADVLVTKDDIIDAAWPGVIASDESLSHCISEIRAAIGDTDRKIIRTVPGRGYRFAAEVKRVDHATDPVAVARGKGIRSSRAVWFTVAAAIALIVFAIGIVGIRDRTSIPEIRASIAVFPFSNTTGEPEIEPLATGLALDLNAALARIPEMLVISETATRRYRDESTDIRKVADVLGVEHILTGSVQKSGDQVRVSVQLLDNRASALWTERYDRPLSDFLKIQDDIVRRVLVGMQIKLTHGESVRVASRGTNNLEAWLASFEGLHEGFKFTREGNRRARDLLMRASRLDPAWALPVGGLAWTYREAIRRGWSSDVESDRREWFRLASKCREIDPHYFGCFIQLGNYFIENDRIDEGIALREKALELAPSDLSALSGLAWQLILVGDVKRGLELLQRAKLVSPLHPAWLIATEAYGYQVDGQYAKAIAGYQYALEHGDFPDWHARIAAVYAQIGDMENARKHARLFVEMQPNRTVSHLTQIMKIQDPDRTRQYVELLRKSGIPD